jgi:uncharacterized protein (DUF2267 family)
MDELINKVAERAGIDTAQAQKAVEAVIEQLQERLPEPLGSMLQNLLDGNAEGKGLADQLQGLTEGGLGNLGGLLGR